MNAYGSSNLCHPQGFLRNSRYTSVETLRSKTNTLDHLEHQITPIPVVEQLFTDSLKQLFTDRVLAVLTENRLYSTLSSAHSK